MVGRVLLNTHTHTLGITTVSWVSKLHKIVALSTTKAKYDAVSKASEGMIWLLSFLEELVHKYMNSVLHLTVT